MFTRIYSEYYIYNFNGKQKLNAKYFEYQNKRFGTLDKMFSSVPLNINMFQ